MTEHEIERMVVRLVGDSSSYNRMMVEATRTANDASNKIGNVASQVEAKSSGMLKMASLAIGGGIAAAVAGVGVVLTKGYSLASEAEKAQTSFEVMLGSTEKAKALVDQMRSFAAATPFETAGIQASAKTLLQFGVTGENVMPILKMLGDVSGGDAQRFSQMSLAFGQVAASGKLMGQDLLQMINAGFNPLQTMSKTTGKSMGQLKQEMERGAISTAMVVKAFEDATKEGGQFFGMMDKQSRTFSGLFSTLTDNISMSLMIVFEKLSTVFNFKGILNKVVAFTGDFSNNIGENMGTLIAYVGRKWEELRDWITNILGDIPSRAAQVGEYIGTAFMTSLQNTVGFFMNFRENVAAIWGWLARNWRGVLVDLGNLVVVVMGNMAANVGVAVRTNFRLWNTFYGWMTGRMKAVFSFEFVDAVLTGLIKAGEKIREWAAAAWESIKAIFSGKKAPGALDEFINQARDDFKNGMDNASLLDSIKGVLSDEAKNIKNPLEGFKSSIEEAFPGMKLDIGGGMDLPEFVWNKADAAKQNFGKAVMGMTKPLEKEIKKIAGIEAVAYDSAEAVARVMEFRAMGRIGEFKKQQTAGKSSPGGMIDVSNVTIGEGLKTAPEKADMLIAGINRLVEIGQEDLRRTKDTEFIAAEIA